MAERRLMNRGNIPERRAEEIARRRRLNRAYFFQNGFVALVAFLFLSTSVSFFIDPTQVGRALGHVPPFDYYWNAFYLLGSVLVLYGLFSRRIGVEAAGHILFVPGLLLNFVLAVQVIELHVTTLLTVVFAVASALRAWGLIVGWQEANNER